MGLLKNSKRNGIEMDTAIEKALSALHARKMKGIFAEDCQEANRQILDLIPLDATVGS